MLVAACLIVQFCSAQDSSRIDKVISLPNKIFNVLDKKTSSIDQRLVRQTNKYIDRLQKREHKLRNKLCKKDSALARHLFGGSDAAYGKIKTVAAGTNSISSVYSGHLDSLTTSLNLLKQVNASSTAGIEKTLDQYKSLQNKLDASDQIKQVLEERQRLLKEQFEKLGMIRELRGFEKDVYYYQQQVKEYRQAINDPSKVEEELMEVAMKVPQFKDFFARNSIVGRLFSLPPNYNTSLALTGLQTRAQIQQQVLQPIRIFPN